MRYAVSASGLAVCAALLFCAGEALAQAASGPVPHGAAERWVTPDDYPYGEWQRGVEGKVTVRLSISSEGKPTACMAIAGSGSEELDAAACRALMARADFDPARDATGRPIAGTWTTRIVWQLPDDAVPRPAPAIDDNGSEDDEHLSDEEYFRGDDQEDFGPMELDCTQEDTRRLFPLSCTLQSSGDN